MTGADLDLAQQQLRRLAVGQRAGKLHASARPAIRLAMNACCSRSVSFGLRGERAQELAGRGLRIRLAHREPAGQEIAEHAGRRVVARARPPPCSGEGSAAAQADSREMARRSARRALRICCIRTIYFMRCVKVMRI